MNQKTFRSKSYGTLLIYQHKDLVGIVNVTPNDVVVLEQDCTYEFVENYYFSPKQLSKLFA